MLAAHERPSMIVPTILSHHANLVVGAGATAAAAVFAALDSATASEAIGVWGAGGVVLAMVTTAFNALWRQNRSMARRIAHLESELDGLRTGHRVST